MRFFIIVGMILLLIGFANWLPIHSVSAQEIQPTETSEPSTATEDIDSAEAEEGAEERTEKTEKTTTRMVGTS